MDSSGIVRIMCKRGCWVAQEPPNNHHVGRATEVQEVPQMQWLAVMWVNVPIVFQERRARKKARENSRYNPIRQVGVMSFWKVSINDQSILQDSASCLDELVQKITKFEKKHVHYVSVMVPPGLHYRCQCQDNSVQKLPEKHSDPWPVQRVQVLRGLREDGARWAFDLDEFFVESTTGAMAWNGLSRQKT